MSTFVSSSSPSPNRDVLDEALIQTFAAKRREASRAGSSVERKHWRKYITHLNFECRNCIDAGEKCQLNENPGPTSCRSCSAKCKTCSHVENFYRWRVRYRTGRISEEMYDRLEAECQRRKLLERRPVPDIGVQTVKQDPEAQSHTFPSQTQSSVRRCTCGDPDVNVICLDCGDTDEPSRPAFFNVDDESDDEARTKREEIEPKLSWASTSQPALPRRRSLGKEKETWEQKDKEYRQQITELKGTIRELRGRLEEEKVKSQAHGPASSRMGVLSGQTSSFLPPLDNDSPLSSYIRTEYFNVSYIQDVFTSALADYDKGTLDADEFVEECRSHDRDLASLRRRLRLSVHPEKRSRGKEVEELPPSKRMKM